MATKHLTAVNAVRQIAGMMNTKNNKFIRAMVIPLLAVSLLFGTTSIHAQEAKPLTATGNLSPVTPPLFENPANAVGLDFSPDAGPFYGESLVPPEKMILAERGGKYVDEENYLRPGVPVPADVRFDKDFKGVRPPTGEDLKALLDAPVDTSMQLSPAEFAEAVKRLNESDPEAMKRGAGFKPVPTSPGHTFMGFFTPYLPPYVGLQGTNSSPYWAMTAHPFNYLFSGPTMYPGDGCLEGTMLHQRTVGQPDSIWKGSYNHCTPVAGAYPQSSVGWVSLETRSPVWIAAYERPVWVSTTYWEYVYVYNSSQPGLGDYLTCSMDVIYNFTLNVWDKKADICGNQTTGLWGSAWVGTETAGLWQSGAWVCAWEGSIRTDNLHSVTGIPSTWTPASVTDTPFYNTVSPACPAWKMARNASTPGTGYQTWQ